MFRCGGKNFRACGAAGGGWVDMGVVVTEYLTTPALSRMNEARVRESKL